MNGNRDKMKSKLKEQNHTEKNIFYARMLFNREYLLFKRKIKN